MLAWSGGAAGSNALRRRLEECSTERAVAEQGVWNAKSSFTRQTWRKSTACAGLATSSCPSHRFAVPARRLISLSRARSAAPRAGPVPVQPSATQRTPPVCPCREFQPPLSHATLPRRYDPRTILASQPAYPSPETWPRAARCSLPASYSRSSCCRPALPTATA